MITPRVEFTVGEALDAMTESIVPLMKEDFIRYDSAGNALAACVLGQGAIKLQVSAQALYDALNLYVPVEQDRIGHFREEPIGDLLAEYNDESDMTLPEIVEKVRQFVPPIIMTRKLSAWRRLYTFPSSEVVDETSTESTRPDSSRESAG